MNIKSTKYVKSSIFNPNNNNTSITLTLSNDTTLSVPICVGNTEYDEIQRQVDAGTLTIAAAD